MMIDNDALTGTYYTIFFYCLDTKRKINPEMGNETKQLKC